MVICEFLLLGEGIWSRAEWRGEPFSSQIPYIYFVTGSFPLSHLLPGIPCVEFFLLKIFRVSRHSDWQEQYFENQLFL